MILTLNRCYYLSSLFVLLAIKTACAQPNDLQLTFLTNLANLRDHLLQGSQDSLVDFSQTFEVVDEAVDLLKADGKLRHYSHPGLAMSRRHAARGGRWESPNRDIALSDYGVSLFKKYPALFFFRELGYLERKYPFQIPADLPILRELEFYDLQPQMRILELNHDACPLWVPIGLAGVPVKFIRLHGKECNYLPQHHHEGLSILGIENHIPWTSQEASYLLEKKKIQTPDSLDRIICYNFYFREDIQMDMLKAARKLLKSDGQLVIHMVKTQDKVFQTKKEMKAVMRRHKFTLISEQEELDYYLLKYRKR